jgi:hypothetical protein
MHSILHALRCANCTTLKIAERRIFFLTPKGRFGSIAAHPAAARSRSKRLISYRRVGGVILCAVLNMALLQVRLQFLPTISSEIDWYLCYGEMRSAAPLPLRKGFVEIVALGSEAAVDRH